MSNQGRACNVQSPGTRSKSPAQVLGNPLDHCGSAGFCSLTGAKMFCCCILFVVVLGGGVVWFWSLWSISPVLTLKKGGEIKLQYVFDHSDSEETQNKSLLHLSVFRTRFLRAVKFNNYCSGNLNRSLKYINIFASSSSKYLITIWWLEDFTVRNLLPLTVVSFAKKKLSSRPAPEFTPTF